MPNRLTVYELELMDVLWEIGEGTVQDVCNGLKRNLAYTTVMTSLNILVRKKGVVTRTKTGRAYVYRPKVTREQMSQAVLDELRPVLFRKALPSLVVNMLSREKLNEDDLDALRKALADVERKQSARKKSP